jgi:hypothetical protein
LGLVLPPLCLAEGKPTFTPPESPDTVFFLKYGVDKEGRSPFNATTRVWRAERGRETVLAYRHVWPEKSWALATDGQGNPFCMVHTERDNAVRFSISGNGTVRLTGVWDGERLDETKTFPPPLSLETCLVLQHMQGRHGEVLEFELIRTEKLPSFTSRRMRFEVLGFDKIRVPAGEFDCMILHFTTANPVLRPFYSGRLYVTNDERRILVRSENVPKDAKLELLQLIREVDNRK